MRGREDHEPILVEVSVLMKESNLVSIRYYSFSSLGWAYPPTSFISLAHSDNSLWLSSPHFPSQA